MASKMVTNRQKSADAVLAVGKAQQSELAAAVPTATALVNELVRRLEQTRDAMVAADAAHERELGDDSAERAARDEAVTTLSSRLVDLRNLFSAIYGQATTRTLFSQPTPRDAVVLARFGAEVANALDHVELPAAKVPGAEVNPATLARELREQCRAVEAAVEAVRHETREAQVTLEARNRAIDEHDRTFQGVATVLTGLLDLAGHEELADKVRPPTRRSGQTDAEEQEEVAAEQGDAAVEVGTNP